MFKQFLLISILGIFVSGCGTMNFNPATGRNEFIMIPTAQEVAMGQGIHATLQKENKFSTDPVRNQRLQQIGQRIATVSDRKDLKYNFYLIDKDEMNAFTVPGCGVYFYTGLFDRLETDDRIAAVMAHEIGHCAGKHTIKKLQVGVGMELLSLALIQAINMREETRQMWRLGSGISTGLVLAAYSRREELEADRLAAKYTKMAGYDPRAMVDALKILDAESKKKGGGGANVPTIMRTHPHMEERIRQLEVHLKNQGAVASRQP